MGLVPATARLDIALGHRDVQYCTTVRGLSATDPCPRQLPHYAQGYWHAIITGVGNHPYNFCVCGYQHRLLNKSQSRNRFQMLLNFYFNHYMYSTSGRLSLSVMIGYPAVSCPHRSQVPRCHSHFGF